MEDLSKLPKWAQNRISVLQSSLDNARARLAVGPENSDTFADPYAEPPRPLGRKPVIRFNGPGHDRTFDVRVTPDGELHVQCNSFGPAPVLKAMASNSFRILWIDQ